MSAEKIAPKATDAASDAASQRKTLMPFIVISISYLLFTMTDGGVRMIVLLHAYNQGFTAMEVAIMFTLYELAGVVTNIAAGMLGDRWGIRWTLNAGLSLQIAGLGMLFGWDTSWDKLSAIVFVTLAQMLCGIAKDLTKLGGKTVTKLVTPDAQQTRLFKLVSLLTGWKNALKGVGYFMGAALLDSHPLYGYYIALAVMVGLVLLAFPWALFGLDKNLGTAKKKPAKLRQILLNPNYNLNMLSLARCFLFGSRDLWFEVPLPFFLRDSVHGLGLPRSVVGAFLAAYIILYGMMQSYTPQLVIGPLGQTPPNKFVAMVWAFMLVPITIGIGAATTFSPAFLERDVNGMLGALIGGIVVFALVFAVNSSVHSYLVVRYAAGDKVATDVGFYYMANAMGRLIGTLTSGALYSYAAPNPTLGFAACMWASSCFCFVSGAVVYFAKDDAAGFVCGPLRCGLAEEGKADRGAGS
ncbi:major facilitator superfamily domain-containing protein [Pavlovales sp. CCMP2436]|nr:major facilitator superfamily domain-containing protein [Pavlovales sp. CCMP2436]